MDRILISYRPILCHHARGQRLARGGGEQLSASSSGVAVTMATFARFDEKVSHGGSQ
jgi:hypothetical protein